MRRLGDLTEAEIAQRCEVPDVGAAPQREGSSTWLAILANQRRAVRIPIAADRRWIAAEDAGLYRDALGAVPPPGLPDAYIALTEAPLEHLLRRYARTHGPFLTREPAARLGLQPAQVEPALRLLETQGTLVRGEIRPGGVEPEWCDAQVLASLRRRTLARARDAVAPVDAATLGRFLPAWHGIGEDLKGPDRLLEAVHQLAGLPLPWSQLDRVLLPARVPGYRPQDLDLLTATGQVVWIGRGALGPKDGKVALYQRGSGEWSVASGEEGGGEFAGDGLTSLHRCLLDHLRSRGACFLMELQAAAERTEPRPERGAFESAVWDLVWAGLITNDTCAPLRSLGGGVRTRRRGRESALAGGRWSLVADLNGRDRPPRSDTERLLAQARMLLERYGVVSREAVQAEGLPGGFSPLYRVLKQMEESGRVRRGWFVEGLSGAQFALAGALEQLRAVRLDEAPIDGFTERDLRVLPALDPANPYGALLPWPATGDGAGEVAGGSGAAPRRVSGAWVCLVAGKPVLYLGSSGRQLTSFPTSISETGGELPLALAALCRLPGGGRRRLLIQQIDGRPALQSPLREAMLAAGFESDYDALVPGHRRAP